MVDVSVVVTTYNGEKYIFEQLESILNQSEEPGEIIIVDDCSTDATPEILSEYSSSHPDIIDVYENKENLGVEKNIEKGLNIVSGDIIAISDQDDIWHEDKLKEQKIILKDTNSDLVFHNSRIFSRNKDVTSTLWENLGISSRDIVNEEDLFHKLLFRNFVQGATMVFKKKILKYILPIPKNTKYDYFIALCTAGCGNVKGIDEILLKYRQHDDQQIGVERGGYVDRLFDYQIPNQDEVQQEIISKYKTYAEVAYRLRLCDVSKRDYLLQDLIEHYKSRHMIYQGEKTSIFYILSNLRRYRDYDNYNSIIADIIHSNKS